MGDVALTVPVLKAFSRQYPTVHITVLTRAFFVPMFQQIPNLTVIIPDLKKEHKGLLGLLRLYGLLKNTKRFDAIIDLHDVLRSIIVRNLFSLSGVPVFKVNKGRKAKKKATAKSHSPIQPLQHVTERYSDVFKKAGFNIDLNLYDFPKLPLSHKVQNFIQTKNKPLIGIAPFAAYDTKMYPLDQMKQVAEQLAQNYDVLIFGGPAEKEITEKIFTSIPNVHSVIGQFSLIEEMTLLQNLSLLVAMDSSNMHLARLVGTKVVSIWGATHPFLGFSPFNQFEKSLMVQIPVETLPCRPCSVYGNQPCHRGDFACMKQIQPENIIQRINIAI